MKDCIFCKIIDGDIPSNKIYEDKYTLAFLAVPGDFYGHTLVIPKVHCVNTLDASEEVLAKVMATVKKVGNHFVGLGYEGVNILNANGKASGQSVFHLHYHIIPRKEDDGMDLWPHAEHNQFDLKGISEKLKIK